jgi:uncharacterized membrane protein YtjA (UPF0391 family)
MLKLTWVFLILAVICGLLGATDLATRGVWAFPPMLFFTVLALASFVANVVKKRPKSQAL